MYQIIEQWHNTDRAAHYGDGVFTTMLVRQGQIALFDYHLARLHNDTQRMQLPSPDEALIQAIKARALSVEEGVLKLVLSAGTGGRGYQRPTELLPCAQFFESPLPNHYMHWQQQGITLGISDIKLAYQPLLAGIKHLNRLEQVFIKQDLAEKDSDDCLVFNYADELVEASMGNLFILDTKNTWCTPELEGAGVKGVMRAFVIDQLDSLNQPVNITRLKLQDLINAKALMLTNALMQVVPVNKLSIDKHVYIKDTQPVRQLSKQLGLSS